MALFASLGRRARWSLGLLVLIGALAWWAWRLLAVSSLPASPMQCALPAEPLNAPHPGMVWVPGGRFEFGDDVYPEEGPVRQVQLAGFWMDRTEVTNDAFAAFVQATGYQTVAERPVDAARHPGLPADMRLPGAVVFVPPNAVSGQGSLTEWWRYMPGADWRHPGGPQTSLAGRGAFAVVNVTVEDAQAYARWKGHGLPSEAQWEWAARGGQTAARLDHKQPKAANTWQGIFPVRDTADDGFAGLAPVGCFAPNALGLFDMIGNAWELTADVYRPDHASGPAPDQVPPLAGRPVLGQHVIKGGSFLCAPNYCKRYRSGARQPQEDDLASSHLGFRTILVAPAP